MDPNANLKEQREIITRLRDCDLLPDPHDTFRLVELCLALDQWISRGGFLPTEWNYVGN